MLNTVGNRIKTLRKEHNLNQKEFAKILNIQNTTLSQYENGINTPSDEMKIMIADYFDVSIDYLLGRSNTRKKDELKIALNSISTDGLDEDDLEIVKSMIQNLRKKNNSTK